MPLMKTLLNAALVAAALGSLAPMVAPAAHADGASEHNQPYVSRYSRQYRGDHDRDWRRDHERYRDRYSYRRHRDDDRRHRGHHRHENSAEERFWRLVR